MPKSVKEKITDAPLMEEEKMSESYLSIGLGLLVVLIVGVLLYNYFASRSKQKSDIGQEGAQQEQLEASPSAETTGSYTVQSGDTLWNISEKYYGNGYEWERIALENNIVDANMLEEGQKLILPTIQKTLPDTGISGEAVVNTYIVQEGDTLWSIAGALYEDSYQWPKIAQANGLTDPQVIHTGNELQIPN